ncbi:hypothetical protein ACFL3D_01925 [Candidatus Omnitrophota bacterium]
MNYVDAFFQILNGSYQTSGRNLGPLKCRKRRHSIADPANPQRRRTVQTIEVVKRGRDDFVALSDMSGKILLKYDSGYNMFPNSVYNTYHRFEVILENDYEHQGMANFRGEDWYVYQYKKSPLTEIYGINLAQRHSFKSFLIAKYGERT